MSDADRANILQALDLRHDQVLEELAQLSQRIELALSALRHPGELGVRSQGSGVSKSP